MHSVFSALGGIDAADNISKVLVIAQPTKLWFQTTAVLTGQSSPEISKGGQTTAA